MHMYAYDDAYMEECMYVFMRMSSWARQSTYTHEAKKDIFSSLEHPSKNTLVSVSVFLPLLTRFPCPWNRCMCAFTIWIFRKYIRKEDKVVESRNGYSSNSNSSKSAVGENNRFVHIYISMHKTFFAFLSARQSGCQRCMFALQSFSIDVPFSPFLCSRV